MSSLFLMALEDMRKGPDLGRNMYELGFFGIGVGEARMTQAGIRK
jgi:hypothetical protein